jgi:hypothetical protein
MILKESICSFQRFSLDELSVDFGSYAKSGFRTTRGILSNVITPDPFYHPDMTNDRLMHIEHTHIFDMFTNKTHAGYLNICNPFDNLVNFT